MATRSRFKVIPSHSNGRQNRGSSSNSPKWTGLPGLGSKKHVSRYRQANFPLLEELEEMLRSRRDAIDASETGARDETN